MTFTTNLCPNPSIEAGTTGYVAVNGAAVDQDTSTAQFGGASLVLSTPGNVPGEGFTGPQVTLGADTTCSVSLYLQGQQGTVTVSAVTSGGVILSQVTVPVTVVFTRVVLDGLAVSAGNVLYIMVTTPTVQNLLVWADGVQYEPESPGQPYCDGDQPGCFWTGTPELSSSFQPYQYFIATTGRTQFDGYGLIIQLGEAFPLFPIEDVGETIFSGSAAAIVIQPVCSFDDFAVYELTDTDPAMTYPWWNNSGIMTGFSGYSRFYMMVTPPLDYIVSDGSYLWRRAAFASLGVSFASVNAGAAENLTDVQLEFALINGSAAVGPRAFQPPRQLQVDVEPDRLNYIANPSFEISLQGWDVITS